MPIHVSLVSPDVDGFYEFGAYVAQCVFLASVAAVVCRVVEGGDSSPRSSRLWPRLLRHLPGTFPISLLSPAKVSVPHYVHFAHIYVRDLCYYVLVQIFMFITCIFATITTFADID